LALFTTFITVWFTATTDSYTQEYTNSIIPFTNWVIPYAGRTTFTTVGVTATVLILGEIIPKRIAIRWGLRVLLILWFFPAIIYLCLIAVPLLLHWVLRLVRVVS
jgi:CBS domain containing-hemolysin-like protein